jgi:hypothetical protein
MDGRVHDPAGEFDLPANADFGRSGGDLALQGILTNSPKAQVRMPKGED